MACYQFHTTMKIAVLPGDGIGTEIVAEAVKVLKVLGLPFEMETALVGGAAYEAHGHPLPESTLNLAKAADAVLKLQQTSQSRIRDDMAAFWKRVMQPDHTR